MKDITAQETLAIRALKQKPVILDVPVVRGKTRITEVSIRKPTIGDSRAAPRDRPNPNARGSPEPRSGRAVSAGGYPDTFFVPNLALSDSPAD